MNAYEKNLLNGIPQDEAAAYFLRVTGRDKLAAASLEDAWNELPAEEQDQILKEAMDAGLLSEKEANAAMMGGGGAAMGPPPAPAKMPAPTPQALPATAQGMNSKMAKVHLKGDERKLHHLEKHPHENAVAQGLGGALSGAIVGAHIGEKGKRLRSAGRMGLGLGAASAGAGYLSDAFDKAHHRKNIASKVISDRLKEAAASLKIAFDNQGAAPPPSGGQEEDEPSLEEYLQQEAAGMKAEETGGASFFQQRLQNAMQELEAVKAQSEQTAAQAEQLQQQVSQNDEAIQASMQQAQMAQQSAMANVQQAHEMAMQATNQAMESQAEVLRQKQLAAAMRMGVQTLKDNVMGAMAQDPTDELAKQLQAPPPGAGGMVGGQPPPPPAPIDPMTGQPMVDPAMMGQDPNAQAGAAPPPAAGGEGGEKKPSSSSSSGEKKEKSESKSEDKGDDKKKDGGTHVEVKTGSIAARFLELTKDLRRA